MKVEIVTSSDGSHTLFVPELNETYHSTHGAIQESNHVFIINGLLKSNKTEVSILEVGFGTGLNALLTIVENEKLQKSIFYTTLEAFPIEESIAQQLNYPNFLPDSANLYFESIHQSPWNQNLKLTPNFEFIKIHTSLENFQTDHKYDIIFYDAFAPSKQADMWEFEKIKHVSDFLNNDGLFVTYCSKGQFKRDLKSLGFTIECPEGPPGKREMTIGFKN